VLPAPQQFTLENGMRVLVLEKHDLPLVQVNIMIGAGTTRDSAVAGLASHDGRDARRGRGRSVGPRDRRQFEVLGARFGIGADAHGHDLAACTPQQLEPALRLAADVILRPDFPQHELDRLRTERLTALVRRYDEPERHRAVLFDQTLFGDEHPYGRDAIGSPPRCAHHVADLRAFHRRYYRPGNSTAIVVGDIDAAARAASSSCSAHGSVRRARRPCARPHQVRGRTIYIVDKPGPRSRRAARPDRRAALDEATTTRSRS
jgi:zinc protease